MKVKDIQADERLSLAKVKIVIPEEIRVREGIKPTSAYIISVYSGSPSRGMFMSEDAPDAPTQKLIPVHLPEGVQQAMEWDIEEESLKQHLEDIRPK